MTKSTKVYVAVLGLVLLLVAVYGWNCGRDIWGEKNPNRVLEQNVEIMFSLDEEDEDSPYFCNDADCSLKDLEERADLIAVVSLEKEQTAELYSTKSKVKLEKILVQKDEALSDGDEIWVEEIATIISEENYDTEGYALMKPGQQYILLLQHLPCIEGYRYSKEEEITYMPVSVYFGKYCITESETIKALQESELEDIHYSQVSDYALYTTNGKVAEKYEKLYQEVLQKWQ